ncbi:MAG TPA: alpha/beta fold hydrolase [Mycobacteriales bacterium]|jgi:pimeloyl-ACP methyl ester carboxylesterase|nr:alpha/beta fold hydrolase [Mycobacteriales bacterium]
MRDDHPLPGTDHVVDDVRLHVVHHGSGDGLPVLLVHGVPTSSYLWRDVQRDLGHAHRTYAVDLAGLGCSERPADGRYDLATQAALLLGLLDDLGLDRVAVVGHDVGGGVAVNLAAVAADRVAALVLVDTPLHADTWPVPAIRALAAPYLGEAQTALLRLAPGAGEKYLATQLARGLRATELSRKSLTHYTAPLLSADGARGLLGVIRAADPQQVEAAFALVAAEPPPALVLWGEADAWFSPAVGRRIAGELRGASFVEVPDAGHFLPEDRPERVAEEIEGFLAELAATV